MENKQILTERTSGILLGINSLPGTFGIGDFGDDAYHFVDKMEAAKVKLWQILPLNPVGYGNSPYQTYSAFAGDEIYISIETLYAYLKVEFDSEKVITDRIDYEQVRNIKNAHLRNAYTHFVKDEAYDSFVKEAFWLEDYVKFMSLKKQNNMQSWLDWTVHDVNEDDLDFERFIQYIFFIQWQDLKAYANDRNVSIVGDIPIYLGHDSADVYFNRDQFYLDQDGRPTLVAGVPPDFFSTEGQLWGNPLYNWEQMEADHYQFWINRMLWNQKMYDVIRIDHFRAFDTYWAIDAASNQAKLGEWVIGPRNTLFDALYAALPDLKIVVEDLGDLRPEVLELRDDYNLMGMKIVEFSLNKWDLKNDVNLSKNLLAYTGTHDNQTIVGWLEELGKKGARKLRWNLRRLGYKNKDLYQRINHYTLGLPCNWAIIPMQDIMGLDNRARINTPSTIGSPNWEWKLETLNSIEAGMEYFGTLVKATNR